MIANERKSYLSYLNKLAEEYNNTYHHSISTKVLILTILIFISRNCIEL